MPAFSALVLDAGVDLVSVVSPGVGGVGLVAVVLDDWLVALFAGGPFGGCFGAHGVIMHCRTLLVKPKWGAECKDLGGWVTLPPMSVTYPRPFALVRDEDVSGVSGTGVVAEGVEFSDGSVALRWTGATPTSVVFHDKGVESVIAVHGHGGCTRIVWAVGQGEQGAAVHALDLRLSL